MTATATIRRDGGGYEAAVHHDGMIPFATFHGTAADALHHCKERAEWYGVELGDVTFMNAWHGVTVPTPGGSDKLHPVFGAVEPKPLRGFPRGKFRLRIRNNEYVTAVVRTGDGIRRFNVGEHDGFWWPMNETGENTRGNT